MFNARPHDCARRPLLAVAGPATMRYNALVKDGTWSEVGDRIVPGKEPERFFEMKLKRVGDSEWPGGGAIPPK